MAILGNRTLGTPFFTYFLLFFLDFVLTLFIFISLYFFLSNFITSLHIEFTHSSISKGCYESQWIDPYSHVIEIIYKMNTFITITSNKMAKIVLQHFATFNIFLLLFPLEEFINTLLIDNRIPIHIYFSVQLVLLFKS